MPVVTPLNSFSFDWTQDTFYPFYIFCLQMHSSALVDSITFHNHWLPMPHKTLHVSMLLCSTCIYFVLKSQQTDRGNMAGLRTSNCCLTEKQNCTEEHHTRVTLWVAVMSRPFIECSMETRTYQDWASQVVCNTQPGPLVMLKTSQLRLQSHTKALASYFFIHFW